MSLLIVTEGHSEAIVPCGPSLPFLCSLTLTHCGYHAQVAGLTFWIPFPSICQEVACCLSDQGSVPSNLLTILSRDISSCSPAFVDH